MPILLIAAGLGAGYALRWLLVRYRHNEWVAALLTYYGVRPSGSDGVFTRKDHLRSAGISALVGSLCAIFGMVLYDMSFKRLNGEVSTMALEAYGFILFVLSAVAVLAGLQALYRAVFWRPMVLVDTTRAEIQDSDPDA